MLYLLIPLLQTEPTPDPRLDIIRILSILVGILVSGGLIFGGGVLLFLISLFRAVHGDTNAMNTIKSLIASLERSHPGVTAELDKAGDVLLEGGKLLDDLTGNTPPTDPTVKKTVTVTSTTETEPGKVG